MQIVNGDLLGAKEKYVAHICNATSKQAAGIAYQLFTKFPYANIYKDRPPTNYVPDTSVSSHAPGNIIIRGSGFNDETPYIINCIAMLYPGAPFVANSIRDGLSARETYFRKCLMKIAATKNIESIAWQYGVGSGLAGGNWTNYLAILENFERTINERQPVKMVLYKKD